MWNNCLGVFFYVAFGVLFGFVFPKKKGICPEIFICMFVCFEIYGADDSP